MSFVIPSTQEDTTEMFTWLANQIVERSTLAQRVKVLEVDLDAVVYNRDSARNERDGAYQEVSRLAGIVNSQATEIESLRAKLGDTDFELRGMKVDAERNAVQFRQLEANRDWWIEQAKVAEQAAADLRAELASERDVTQAQLDVIKRNNDQFAESLKAKDDALNELSSQLSTTRDDLAWERREKEDIVADREKVRGQRNDAIKERDAIQMVVDKIEAVFASFRAPPVPLVVNPPTNVEFDPHNEAVNPIRDNVVGF